MTRLEERIKACERLRRKTKSVPDKLRYVYEEFGLRGRHHDVSDRSLLNAYQRGLSDRATLLKLEGWERDKT